MVILLKRYKKEIMLVVVFFIIFISIIGGIWCFGQLKYKAGVNDTEAKYQQQITELNEAQRSIEREAQNQVNELSEKAEHERQKTQSIIDNVSADNDRLRQRAEVLASKLRESASSATSLDVEAAAQGWALFGSCTKRYENMGAIADKQRDDLKEWQGYGGVMELMK